MLFTGLHRRMYARALALLLSVAVCGGLNVAHAGGDDPDCAPQFVQHDHAAHRFTAAPRTAQPQDEHCTLCHLLRLLHTALPSRSPLDSRISLVEARGMVDTGLITSISIVTVPSRAPPTASL